MFFSRWRSSGVVVKLAAWRGMANTGTLDSPSTSTGTGTASSHCGRSGDSAASYCTCCRLLAEKYVIHPREGLRTLRARGCHNCRHTHQCARLTLHPQSVYLRMQHETVTSLSCKGGTTFLRVLSPLSASTIVAHCCRCEMAKRDGTGSSVSRTENCKLKSRRSPWYVQRAASVCAAWYTSPQKWHNSGCAIHHTDTDTDTQTPTHRHTAHVTRTQCHCASTLQSQTSLSSTAAAAGVNKPCI